MPIQTKCMRRRSIAIALLLGCPLFVPGQCALADGPSAKGKTKEVPAYVATHFEKPKVRSIHTNKATIRSGPSERYYATSTLMSGATVDVYMETSDGWSGIRPPAGSHDWIPSNIAYLLPGGKSAEIIEEKSPAWVGSDSSDVPEFMWQMELVKSQQVQVLGEEFVTFRFLRGGVLSASFFRRSFSWRDDLSVVPPNEPRSAAGRAECVPH